MPPEIKTEIKTSTEIATPKKKTRPQALNITKPESEESAASTSDNDKTKSLTIQRQHSDDSYEQNIQIGLNFFKNNPNLIANYFGQEFYESINAVESKDLENKLRFAMRNTAKRSPQDILNY